MLRGAGDSVKPGFEREPEQARGFTAARDLPQTPRIDAILPIAQLIAFAAAFAGWQVLQRSRRRQHVVSGLLDAADALEARLRAARGEIEAIAGDHENPVRGAMQDILRQRLWLQEHAANATLAQLQAVRDALGEASLHLDQQLQQIARVRGAA